MVDTPILQTQAAQTANPKEFLNELNHLYPLGRIALPEDVAHVICFLSSSYASYITGSLLTVDGGLTAQ